MANPLLLLHGALGSAAQFEQLEKTLKPTTTVYSMNFEGHGGRLSDRDFSMPVFVKNVVDFLDEKEIETADIFGYSMGGYVALCLAHQLPDRVGRIITLGTKLDWTMEVYEAQKRMLDPEKIEAKVPAFAATLAKTHAPNDWKTVVHKTADMMKMLASGEKLSDTDLKAIRQSVTIAVGDQDHMVSREESEHASELMTKAKLEVLKDTPHAFEKVSIDNILELLRDV